MTETGHTLNGPIVIVGAAFFGLVLAVILVVAGSGWMSALGALYFPPALAFLWLLLRHEPPARSVFRSSGDHRPHVRPRRVAPSGHRN
jgi:hypothetical protein